MAINMTFVDFVTPVPADWLNNVNTVVNNPTTQNYTAPFTGSVTRTFTSKLSDVINAKDFGAVGNGVADDTVAIQKALDAAGNNGTVILNAGTYLVSATLNGHSNLQLKGSGPNSTIIQRTGNYGHTYAITTAAQAATVEGIWFNHSTFYTAGQTSLANLATSGAHIYMVGAQGALINNCLMWRLPYGIQLEQSTITTVNKCWIQGVWDPANAGCQEGLANIYLSNAIANCEIIKITNNYLNGAKSAARNITYTASDGSQTVSRTQNIGPQFGVLIDGCEDLLIQGNFIGAQYNQGVYARLNAAGNANLDWRIIGNFFDDGPSVGASIHFGATSAGPSVNGVTISGNVFNGELQGVNAIQAFNDGAPGNSVLSNFSITGNSFLAHVGCPIALYACNTGTVSGNTITAYNSVNTSPGNDPTFCAGIGLFGVTQYVNVNNNTTGGQVNTGLPGGFTYQGISNTSSGAGTNLVHHNMAIGVGLSVNQSGLQDSLPTQLTIAGSYTATPGDQVVCARAAQTGAWTFGLPVNPPPGRKITFKDAAGSAATFNVQVLGTVDGVTNPTYNTNFFTKTFYWNGVQWNVIGN